VLGDINFIRSPSNRNKPGGDINNIFLFNEAISYLGLVELPLKGRKFTWSNMQNDSLMERLYWFFTSSSWTVSYPSTFVYPLVKPTSDHLPSVLAIGTKIPRANVFRFENYWLQHSEFKQIVQNSWNILVGHSDSAKRINTKLKKCKKHQIMGKESSLIKKSYFPNVVIDLLDTFEGMRTLSLEEWNLIDMLKTHVIILLQNQKPYWKQRGKIKWVKLGDANTNFFHSKAATNFRHNYISMLKNEDETEIRDHEGKASILWHAFKERKGNLTNQICSLTYRILWEKD
jgi:hypothetical protein